MRRIRPRPRVAARLSSPRVHIEALNPDDAATLLAASELLRDAFGPGGYPIERVRTLASAPDVYFACARAGEVVIAVGVARAAADLAAPARGAGAASRAPWRAR